MQSWLSWQLLECCGFLPLYFANITVNKIIDILRVLRIEDVINEIVLKATPLVLSQQTGSSVVMKRQN